MLKDRDLEEWKRQRTKTFIVFVCEVTALGMEQALTFITLWLYLEKILQDTQPKLHYSLISAAYLFSQVVASTVIGRYADKTRNVKAILSMGNLLIILGNIMYTIPISPWILFAGRLTSGVGGGIRCVMTGEIARSYPESEVSSKFSLMGMAFGLGFLLGPAINFGFINSNFWIGSIHIQYVNAPGFYLALIFILLLLSGCAMVSDLSKEFDLKEASMELDIIPSYSDDTESFDTSDERSSLLKEDENDSSKHEKDSPLTTMSVLKIMFKNFDSALIVGLSFILMFCMICFDLWQPLAVLKLNHWGVLEINIIILGYGVAAVLVLVLVSLFPLSDKMIVYLSLLCTICILSQNIIFLIFKEVPENRILSIFLWVIFDICSAINTIMEEVCLLGIMAKMTASSYQSFAESVRLGSSRTGALVGLLSAASTFSYLTITCSILAAVAILCFVLICARKRTLQNPKVLIQ